MILVENRVTLVKIVAILILALILRLPFAINNLLSGDEVGASVLQASGQAYGFQSRLPKEIVPIKQIKNFVSFCKDFGIKDVLRSLKYSGIHPPFYYLMLHYVLKHAGNWYLILRLVSILLSLGGIIFIFLLGQRVYNKDVGLYAALFFSLSAYGTTNASMVRPYSLALLISLISAFLTYDLNEDKRPIFSKRKLFFFIVINLIGLYTAYHFLFVFIFQIAFLMMYNAANRKKLLDVIYTVAIIVVLYLPWLPSLFAQLRGIMPGHFYFQTRANPFDFINLLCLDFVQCLPAQLILPVKVLISVIITIGAYCLWNKKIRRMFAVALAAYLLLYGVSDWLLNMHALLIRKLHFFIMPIFFIIFSVGIFYVSFNYFIRRIVIVICCICLLWNSMALYYNSRPLDFDGPEEVISFRDKIGKYLEESQKGLVIVSTAQRRYLFSFVHAIETPVDIKIMFTNNAESEISNLGNIKDYDLVFFMKWYVYYNRKSDISLRDVEFIINYLAKFGFGLIEPSEFTFVPNKSTLYIFRKIKNGN